MRQPLPAYSRWNRIRDLIYQFEAAVENTLLIVMVLLVCVQTGLRYFLHISLDWAEDVSRVSFVWLVFLGAMTALRSGSHMGVDILTRFLPGYAARWAERVGTLCVTATLILFIYYGTALCLNSYILRTPVLGLPWTYVYAVVPLSAFGMLLTLLGKLLMAGRRGVSRVE